LNFEGFSRILEDFTRTTKNEIHNLIGSFIQDITFDLEATRREINTFLQELSAKDFTPVGCQFYCPAKTEQQQSISMNPRRYSEINLTKITLRTKKDSVNWPPKQPAQQKINDFLETHKFSFNGDGRYRYQ